jgi:hypothetical protein
MPQDRSQVSTVSFRTRPVPEEFLDWFENQGRSRLDVLLTDLGLFAAYTVASVAVVAGWLLHWASLT